MSIENGNGNGSKRRRNGIEKFKALKDAGEKMLHAINGTSELVQDSVSFNDPKYSEVRRYFERKTNPIPVELMDYALGLRPLPRKDESGQYADNQQAHIAELFKKHDAAIGHALSLGYGAHIRRMEKDESYKEQWENAGKAWEERDIEKTIAALPENLHDFVRGVKKIPNDTEGTTIRAAIQQAQFRPFTEIPLQGDDERITKDLPPMPPEIRERIREYPAAVNYAIIMFTRQLREGDFENELHQKFARYFGEEVEEKAFRHNPNVRDRSRYENAYWAMLSLGVVTERWGTKHKLKHPEVHIQVQETEKQIETFLIFEKIRRLEEKIKSAENGDGEALSNEIATLRKSPRYLNARADHYKGVVPEDVLADPSKFETERGPTIIEALGNRLYVSSRNLPLEKDEIHKALEEIQKEREDVEESTRLPADFRYRHRLLGRFASNVSLESSNADRDVEAMTNYLVAGGSWNDSVQEGFDMIMKGISTNARSLNQQKELAASVLTDPALPENGIAVFKGHEKNISSTERALRKTQTKLLTLWHEYSYEGKQNPLHAEAQKAKDLEVEIEKHLHHIRQLQEKVSMLESEMSDLADEADDHLSSLEILRPKIQSVAEHTIDIPARERLLEALKVIDDYLTIPSQAREIKKK